MSTLPVRVERRIGQRFPYLIPVSFRDASNGIDGLGFTQDVSSRGVLFLTDARLREGCEIELTLNMPSQITLGEDMHVRCRGRILRILRPTTMSEPETPSTVETKIGVAVIFDRYEYLPVLAEPESNFARVVSLHPHPEAEEEPQQLSMRPAEG
jgi:hypothetical protein